MFSMVISGSVKAREYKFYASVCKCVLDCDALVDICTANFRKQACSKSRSK